MQNPLWIGVDILCTLMIELGRKYKKYVFKKCEYFSGNVTTNKLKIS